MIAQKAPDNGGGYVGGKYYQKTHERLDQMVFHSKSIFEERLSKMEITERAVKEFYEKYYKGKIKNQFK